MKIDFEKQREYIEANFDSIFPSYYINSPYLDKFLKKTSINIELISKRLHKFETGFMLNCTEYMYEISNKYGSVTVIWLNTSFQYQLEPNIATILSVIPRTEINNFDEFRETFEWKKYEHLSHKTIQEIFDLSTLQYQNASKVFRKHIKDL